MYKTVRNFLSHGAYTWMREIDIKQVNKQFPIMIITMKRRKQQNDISVWVGSGVGGIR